MEHICDCGEVLACYREDGYCSHCEEGPTCSVCLKEAAQHRAMLDFEQEHYYD